jgi:hypothetical protein
VLARNSRRVEAIETFAAEIEIIYCAERFRLINLPTRLRVRPPECARPGHAHDGVGVIDTFTLADPNVLHPAFRTPHEGVVFPGAVG